MGKDLLTNSNARRDFVENEILESANGVSDAFIAAAFFTDAAVLKQLVNKGLHVRLIVRLGFPTNPDALVQALRWPQVEPRFFSDSSFHPKLYIFGDRRALVGSANLTSAALRTNQEIVVSVDGQDVRFNELATVFSEYWTAAAVLTPEVVEKYRALYIRHRRIIGDLHDFDTEIEREIGLQVFQNIGRDEATKSAENVFLESYRKTYQETANAFRRVAAVYQSVGRRKSRPDQIPLRLEIDSFFSFVRDTDAAGDRWFETPPGWGEARIQQVRRCVEDWLDSERPHFEETIIEDNYPNLTRLFSDRGSVLTSTDDELFGALLTVHSFHDRLRFFTGGLVGLRSEFFGRNEGKRIRESLNHLIFGEGEAISRMADLLFNPKYKLNEFGQANVQELLGWLNREDLPVINGRTTKVLRHFGLDVRQL